MAGTFFDNPKDMAKIMKRETLDWIPVGGVGVATVSITKTYSFLKGSRRGEMRFE